MRTRDGVEACIVSLVENELRENGDLWGAIQTVVRESLERARDEGVMADAIDNVVRDCVAKADVRGVAERIVRMSTKDLDFRTIVRDILDEQGANDARRQSVTMLNERISELESQLGELGPVARPISHLERDVRSVSDVHGKLWADLELRVKKVEAQSMSNHTSCIQLAGSIEGLKLEARGAFFPNTDTASDVSASRASAVTSSEDDPVTRSLARQNAKRDASQKPWEETRKRWFKVDTRKEYLSVRYVDAYSEDQAIELAEKVEEDRLELLRTGRTSATLCDAVFAEPEKAERSVIDMPLPVESPPPPAAGLKRYKVAIREVHDSVRFVDAENEEQAGQIASDAEEHHLKYVRTMDNIPPRVIEWGGLEMDPQFPPVVRVFAASSTPPEVMEKLNRVARELESRVREEECPVKK